MSRDQDIADAYDKLSCARKTHRNILRQPILLHKNKEDAKSWAEAQYVQRLASALGYKAEQVNFTKPADNHPDICLELNNGLRIGIEVTELLDSATLSSRLVTAESEGRYDPNWKIFSLDEYTDGIKNCIYQKSKKLDWVSKFDHVWLLITTAEPDLAFGSKRLSLKLAEGIGDFDKVYVIGERIPSANDKSDREYAFGEITTLGTEA